MRQAKNDVTLLVLGVQLRGTQRQTAALKRKAGRDAQAWQRWSVAVEETVNLASRIIRTPADDLHGVSIKLDAVIWLLTHDDAILDVGAERKLRALAREVRALAER